MVFIGEETSFELARCLDTCGVLEEFGVQLTADDFYQRWGHPMVVSYAGEKKNTVVRFDQADHSKWLPTTIYPHNVQD